MVILNWFTKREDAMTGMLSANPAILPAFREWVSQTSPPMDELAYLYNAMPLEAALVLSNFIFPRIVRHEDGYFVEGLFFESSFKSFRESAPSFSISKIEGQLNYLIVEDLFGDTGVGGEVMESLRSMAQVFAFGWRSAAQAQFPGIPFVVDIIGDLDMIVTMHVDRSNR